MRNFRKYDVWKEAIELVKDIYQVCAFFPDVEKFGLTKQIKRSAVSIPSNIAEGASRSSEKDFKRFIEIAIGSAFELETQLTIAIELGFLQEDDEVEEVFHKLSVIQRKLNSLRSKLS